MFRVTIKSLLILITLISALFGATLGYVRHHAASNLRIWDGCVTEDGFLVFVMRPSPAALAKDYSYTEMRVGAYNIRVSVFSVFLIFASITAISYFAGGSSKYLFPHSESKSPGDRRKS